MRGFIKSLAFAALAFGAMAVAPAGQGTAHAFGSGLASAKSDTGVVSQVHYRRWHRHRHHAHRHHYRHRYYARRYYSPYYYSYSPYAYSPYYYGYRSHYRPYGYGYGWGYGGGYGYGFGRHGGISVRIGGW